MSTEVKRRALVFDDEPDIRQMFHLLLECRGFEVHTFEDPSEYCNLSRVGCSLATGMSCADVIISDLRMPRVDGLQFMQAIADKHCRIPVRALMSGYWSAESLKRARQLGCHTFAKPMKVDSIFRWLDESAPRFATTVPVIPDSCCSRVYAAPEGCPPSLRGARRAWS